MITTLACPVVSKFHQRAIGMSGRERFRSPARSSVQRNRTEEQWSATAEAHGRRAVEGSSLRTSTAPGSVRSTAQHRQCSQARERLSTPGWLVSSLQRTSLGPQRRYVLWAKARGTSKSARPPPQLPLSVFVSLARPQSHRRSCRARLGPFGREWDHGQASLVAALVRP